MTRFTRPLEIKLADADAERARANAAQCLREIQGQFGAAVAYGYVTGTTGALDRSFDVASVSRSGTGVYVITLRTAIDPAARQFSFQSFAGGGPRIFDLDPSLDTARQFRVYVFDATPAAADSDFTFVVRAL